MINKKIIILLASSLVVSACATSSGKQVYRTDSGESLVITGQEVAGYLTLYINGETVIDSVSFYSKDLIGTYNNYKVRAKCEIETNMFSSDKECDIYINEKYASNLFFR